MRVLALCGLLAAAGTASAFVRPALPGECGGRRGRGGGNCRSLGGLTRAAPWLDSLAGARASVARKAGVGSLKAASTVTPFAWWGPEGE